MHYKVLKAQAGKGAHDLNTECMIPSKKLVFHLVAFAPPI